MKLKTRGPEVAQAIADRKAFTTSGALRAIDTDLRRIPVGELNLEERTALESAMDSLDYVVYSYDTPIAWHSAEGWHKVAQTFSTTTSQHQSKLHLID